MSVVKDVDLEAMPSSIFVNDDDDDNDQRCANAYASTTATTQRCKPKR